MNYLLLFIFSVGVSSCTSNNKIKKRSLAGTDSVCVIPDKTSDRKLDQLQDAWCFEYIKTYSLSRENLLECRQNMVIESVITKNSFVVNCLGLIGRKDSNSFIATHLLKDEISDKLEFYNMVRMCSSMFGASDLNPDEVNVNSKTRITTCIKDLIAQAVELANKEGVTVRERLK